MVVERGSRNIVTFKAAASVGAAELNALAYISASNTAAIVNTTTQVPVGTFYSKSDGGAGSAVAVDMFDSPRIGIAGGAITGADQVSYSSTTSGKLVSTPTNTAGIGIAIDGAGVDGEKFEWVPIVWATPITVT
jgi:hypothetical protein